MADMDPYPGLKKKDKEFLESVNSKIRSGTYRDPGTLTRNLKAMNKKISGYEAKVSSYERSRYFITNGDGQIRVTLIVFETNVERRIKLFDPGEFKL
jgi:hypothetical protein